jgi:hypothetical protein
MHYSFYLFVQLRNEIMPNDVEYDLQYGEDLQLFKMYETSEYNVEDKTEYDCMVDFLRAFNDGDFPLILDSFNNYLTKNDWVVLLDIHNITHEFLKPKRGDVLQFIRVNDNDSTIGEFLHLPSNQPLNVFADRTLKLNK